MFNNYQLASFCEQVYNNKWAYWYGTCGYECTLKTYESKSKQYPAHYTKSRKSGYMKDIEQRKRCADCVGMIKAFFWCDGDVNKLPKYKANNCPDKSANGMFKLCEDKGLISTIPDTPGIVVWKDGHIGVSIGDGYAIEMRGFDYDCRKDKIKNRPWTHWGRLPLYMLEYLDSPQPEPQPEPQPGKKVLVTGNSVYVRKGPGINYDYVGIVHKGDMLEYQNEDYENGWHLIVYKNENAWITPKYTVIV